ncbi:MAG: hypothetical protein JNL06_05175 [Alphaproteobacteria bacterium]|nr:hypothetical protein [Alphaproteobacteria bacterium]
MSRSVAIAVLASALAAAVAAAPQNQLVVPNLNPGLKTVPFVPHAGPKRAVAAACEKSMVARIDSGTVITGADGKVAHLTGMAQGDGAGAELVVRSTSPDGETVNVDFVACTAAYASMHTPVSSNLPLAFGPKLRRIAVHAQGNAITIEAR